MNPLATELNAVLEGTAAGRLLSAMGKRLFFPKGIVAQSAEAKKKATRYNATIGVAYSKGKPMILSAVQENLPGLSPAEAVAYAPTAGVEDLRAKWKAEIYRKTPSLGSFAVSTPVVVPGLTAGISILADLFLDEGDRVVVPELFWDNYPLVLETRKGAEIASYDFFDSVGKFNAKGFEEALKKSAKGGKVATILNFPNNPAGWSPTEAEAKSIAAALRGACEAGIDVLAIVDDAYFGLAYEKDIYPESLFGLLANLHPRLVAAKVDGSTKEDFVWGFRLGFVTLAGAGLSEAQHETLVKKLMGAIRSSVSCCNTPGQYIQLKALADPRSAPEKEANKEILAARYREAKAFLAAHPTPAKLEVVPFNSGYFMSFRCKGVSAEAIRQRLLEQHGIGTISIGETFLRVAFASVEKDGIAELYTKLFEVASGL
jgi:aspartate/methionine/tyrosine aminotransferase